MIFLLIRLLIPRRVTSISTVQEELYKFCSETGSNPQIFRAFRFEFPKTLKFIDYSFFTTYPPMHLILDTSNYPNQFKFGDQPQKYIYNLLSRIGPQLESLKIHATADEYGRNAAAELHQLLPFNLPSPLEDEILLPKLTHFACCDDSGEGGDLFERIYNYVKFAFNKSGAIDPTPNLTRLSIDGTDPNYNLAKFIGNDHLTSIGLSRWSKLTRLTIKNFVNQITAATLIILGEGGMRLKSFTFEYPTTNRKAVCLDLSRFLATQSKCLEYLKFEYIFGDELASNNDEERRIHFPVFENVTTFKLEMNYSFSSNYQEIRETFNFIIFETKPLPIHFPKLNHLVVNNYKLLSYFYPNGQISEPLSLKTLELYPIDKEFDEWNKWLEDNIQSVDNFYGAMLDKVSDEVKARFKGYCNPNFRKHFVTNNVRIFW